MILDSPAVVLFESFVKLFLLSAVGYAVVKIRILPMRVIEILSRAVIRVTLPALIIATMGRRLDLSMMRVMAISVLAALALNGGGFIIGLIVRRLFTARDESSSSLILSLSAMQNSGYLPIPLAAAVLPDETRSYGLLLVFIYMLVMSPIFWSFGVWLIAGNTSGDRRAFVRNVANPPLITLLLGMLFFIPQIKAAFLSVPVAADAVSYIGKATVPLVMFILGGSLGETMSFSLEGMRPIALATLTKLIIIPALALGAVLLFRPDPVFGIVLILQAAMPAAMNHIVVARSYGGNVTLTARALFIQYTLSVVTVPLFLYLAT